MCDCSIKFRITDTGYLEVSYDKECTWEQIGKVKGDASTQAGPQGPQGPVGPRGAAGTNGTNGVTPYISQSTGNWVVNGVDTGIKAAGSNGTISVEASQDIATVGTPNVTTRTVNNELIIQFHQLKGAPGVAPTITATRDGNQVFFKVDGVTVATLNDGIVYTAGTYMNIGSGNVLNCTIVQATSSALGLVKLGSDTVQTEAAQTPSATSGRTYPVQVDSDGKAVVNVPWDASGAVNDGALSIKGNGTEVTNFTANSSADKSIDVESGSGVGVTPDTTNSKLKLFAKLEPGSGINLTQMSDGYIRINENGLKCVLASREEIIVSEQGTHFYKWNANMDGISGANFSLVNTNDFYNVRIANPNCFKWTRNTAVANQYISLVNAAATDCTLLYRVEIQEATSTTKKTYLLGIILDTPPDATFTVISSLNWDLVYKGGSNNLYTYMKVPDDFTGTIEIYPLGKKMQSGANCSITLDPNASPVQSKTVLSGNSEQFTCGFFIESQFSGETISVRTPGGKYYVDIITELDGNPQAGDVIYADSTVVFAKVIASQSAAITTLGANYTALEARVRALEGN